MKKLMIVVAMMILVLGLSAVAFANNEVNFDVEMVVEGYGIVGSIDDDEVPYNNLFGPIVTGEPGLYISDGNATKDFALDVWGLEEADVVQPYSSEGTLDNEARVAKFFVDANTATNITLSTDWEGWADTPTLFRISSGAHDELTYSPYPVDATWQDWWTDHAYIFNSVEGYEEQFGLEDLASFEVDFAKCQGPFEFHINGAMYLPKSGQIAADTYNVDLLVTIDVL